MWPFETDAWYLHPRDTVAALPPSPKGVAQKRREACEFIQNISTKLHLYYLGFAYVP